MFNFIHREHRVLKRCRMSNTTAERVAERKVEWGLDIEGHEGKR